MVSTEGHGSRLRASPHSVSPVAVYSYHTHLFYTAAPKLSCLTGFRCRKFSKAFAARRMVLAAQR